MQLAGDQYELIRDALLDAYNAESFASMLRGNLNTRLDIITSEKSNFTTIVKETLDWAQHEDRVDALVAAAKKSNPQNQKLQALPDSFDDVGGEETAVYSSSTSEREMPSRIEQTIHGSQINAGRDVNIGHQGDNIHIEGGSVILGDKNVLGDEVHGDKTVNYGLTTDEVAALFVEIKRTDQPVVWNGDNPYPGLRAFQESDAKYFFGRESLVEELLQRVEDSQFIVIAGPSGSGKSSVARAGLLHALRNGKLDGSENWLLATMSPQGDPLGNLAMALQRATNAETIGAKILSEGNDNPQLLTQSVEMYLTDDKRQRCLLFVDQFEEIFTQTKDPELQSAFIDLLTGAVESDNSRMTILLSMRSDFVSQCARFPALRALMSKQFQLVGAMEPNDLAKAISLPAMEVGAEIEAALVSRILDDMHGEPGTLPLMSFALRDLFDSEQTETGAKMDLALKEYLDRGGIEQALERHANAVFGTFSDEQQALAKNLFSRLIEVGQGRVDTRRTATYLELVPAGTDDAAVTAIVRALADENVRLITTSGAQGFDEAGTVDIEMATVTIAHEKLIDAWPWLRELVDENREMIALQNQINVDAHEWAKNEDAGFLYRGGRLIQVEEKVSALQPNLDELSSRFVQASLAERERMAKVKRRNQLLAAGAASVIVALIIVALLINSAGQQAQLGTQAKAAAQQAVASTREAEDTQELAVRATAVATAVVAAQASEATAVANVNLVLSSALVTGVQNAGDQELRLLLAVEAVRATTDVDQEPNSAAVEALQQVLSQGLTKSLTTSGDFSNVTGGLQFGGNGKYLSLSRGSNAGTATLVDVRASQVVTLPESVTNISYFDFDDAGRFIAAAGDQKVHVLDAATLQVHCAGLPQGNYTAGMAFNPTGAWLYTYSSSGAGRLWDTQRCTMAGTVPPEPFENTISGGVFIGENRLLSVTEDEQRQRMATYWDLTSSTNPISVYQFEFDSLDISDGGTRLARSFDSLVEVIEIETGETVFKHEFEDINSIKVRLSSDGNYLAVSKTLDNVVYLWDVEARALIRELTAFVDRDRRRGIDFVDVAGQPLLVVQNQYQVELRDATNGELEPSPPNFKPVKIKNVATDPRGQELLIALDDGTIRQWDIVNHQEVTRYSQSIGSFDSMEFSPDSQYLATAKTDGTLRFWTNPSARPVSAEPGASIAVDEAGVRVLAEANDKLVLWDPVGNDFRTIPMTDCEQETLQYSYVIGKRWLITEYDNYEQSECASAKSVLWDMIADPPEPVWEAKDVTLAELSILPAIRADGRLIANSVELPFLDDSVWDLQEEPSGNLSETTDLEEWPLDEYAVQVWDTGNGQSSILPHEAFPEYIALHPTEDFVATADEFGQVLLWQLNGHAEPTSTILLPEDEMLGVALNKLAFDVTGQRLFATYDLLPVLRIWDVANRRVEAEVASISTFTLSPERDIAAVTIVSPTLQVEVWDMNTLDPIASSNINDIQEVSFLEIDSVSTRVAVADGKGNVLIWDWAQPDEAMSQISHSLPVMDMAFTDESNVLVTVIEDGSIQTWILELDGMIKAACEIVSRPLTKNEWNSSIGTAKPWRETCP